MALLQGTRFGDPLTGGADDDTLLGGAGRDTLEGGAGNDRLDGGNDADSLLGGEGDDTLVGGSGPDTLAGGDGSDTYVLTSNLVTRNGVFLQEDTVIEQATDSGIDHVITDSRLDVRQQHIENISIVGRNGDVLVRANNLNNVVQIAPSEDYFSIEVHTYGGADLIRGSAGRDRIFAGAGNDTLIGGARGDRLDGGVGADVMSGGSGNDTYFVDNAGDRIIEGADGGTEDTVFTVFDTVLPAALENLYLIGSARIGIGNAKDNRIQGNNEDNLLYGNGGDDTLTGGNGDDTLRGGAGADLYYGYDGSDTFFVMDPGDTVSEEETIREGSDTVVTNQGFTGNRFADIENIHLVGSGDIDAVRYDSTLLWETVRPGELRGNSGNNLLDGASRVADTMLGGHGDDIYMVENKGDVVIEGVNAGTDTVRSTINYALTAHVEQLELQGDRDLKGIGNGLDNVIVGNSGDNAINGREGSDTLTGGAGEDTFVFSRALGPDNVDTIMDLSRNADTILLHSNVFTALSGMAGGRLVASALRGGTEAADANDRIIYDRTTGALYYDADGTGGQAQILFAVLDNQTLISADVFEIA
jgi:Ca2+-binding RTX toxin-like protein